MSLVIVIRNISGLAPISDYDYTVVVGDGDPAHSRTLAVGTLKNHPRSDGWKALVRRMLEEEDRNDDQRSMETSNRGN